LVPATGAGALNGAEQIPVGEAEAEPKARPVLAPSAQLERSIRAETGAPLQLAPAASSGAALAATLGMPAAADQRGLAPSAQALTSNLAGQGTPEGADAQQESLTAALATATGQMAAQQAGHMSQTPSGLTPSAQALTSDLTGQGTPEGAETQQESLTAALATAPGQMAAQQAGHMSQTPNSVRRGATSAKDNAIAARDNAVPVEKQAAAAALLSQALAATELASQVTIITAAERAEASFSLVSLEAAKSAGAKTSGEGRADGLAPQALGFALPDGMLQRTDAPLTSAVARDMPAPPPARQLAPVVVSLALGRGDEALTIALDPGELGRVEVSIGQGKDAGQVRIVAERPETLALLQRDQRELDRALTQAGLGDVARSLSFSLASDQGRQQHQGAAHQGGQRFPGQATGLEAERLLAPISNQARSATSLLDIAV
jgi:Meckel syndrome type 1 protein